MKPKIYLIVATDLKGGIGLKGKLPWDLPGDMEFFKKTTIKTDNTQYRNMVNYGPCHLGIYSRKTPPIKSQEKRRNYT